MVGDDNANGEDGCVGFSNEDREHRLIVIVVVLLTMVMMMQMVMMLIDGW